MNKLRLLLASLTMGLMFVGLTPLAAAHVLKESNGISVVMHIAPFDDPSANEKTRIEFEYGSDQGNFLLNNYTVKYKLSRDGKTITQAPSEPAYFGAASESTTDITFPTIGIYQLTLTGTPTTHTVSDFQVSYVIRVAHAAQTTSPATNGSAVLILLCGSGVVLAVAYGASWMIYRGRRYATTDSSKKP